MENHTVLPVHESENKQIYNKRTKSVNVEQNKETIKDKQTDKNCQCRTKVINSIIPTKNILYGAEKRREGKWQAKRENVNIKNCVGIV